MASRPKVEQARGLDLNAGEQDEESTEAYEELASDLGGDSSDSGERLVASGASESTRRQVEDASCMMDVREEVSVADTEGLAVSDVSGRTKGLSEFASCSDISEVSQSLEHRDETQNGVKDDGRSSCLVDGCKDRQKPLCEVIETGSRTVVDAEATVAEEVETGPDEVKPAEFGKSSHEGESFDKFESSSMEKPSPEVTVIPGNLVMAEISMTKNEASGSYIVAADKSGAQGDVQMDAVVSANVRETAETVDATNLKEVKGVNANPTDTEVNNVGGEKDDSLLNKNRGKPLKEDVFHRENEESSVIGSIGCHKLDGFQDKFHSLGSTTSKVEDGSSCTYKTDVGAADVKHAVDNAATRTTALAVDVGEKSINTSDPVTIQVEVTEIHNQTELELDGQLQPGECAGVSIVCETGKRSCHEKPEAVFVDAGCSGRGSSATLFGMEPEKLEGLADQMDVQVGVAVFNDRNELTGERISCQENVFEGCPAGAAVIDPPASLGMVEGESLEEVSHQGLAQVEVAGVVLKINLDRESLELDGESDGSTNNQVKNDSDPTNPVVEENIMDKNRSAKHVLDANNMIAIGSDAVTDAEAVKADRADIQLFNDDQPDNEHILLDELHLVERVASAETKPGEVKLGSCNLKHKEHAFRVHDDSISNPRVGMSESSIAKLVDDDKNEKTDAAFTSSGLILDKCSCDGEFFMDGLNLSVEISTHRSSELSQVENVVMEDESPTTVYCQNAELDKFSEADQVNVMLGENVMNVGSDVSTNDDHNMMVDEQETMDKQTMDYVARRPCTYEKDIDQGACYYLSSKDEDGFSTSDLVWGKVKSHPWWPGQIFDASDASDLALKYRKKDNFLVAYFGDKTFAWCDESQLKHFEMHFSQMEKQTNSDVFVDAVNGALDEVSRRIAVGMTCFCFPEATSANINYEKVENTGIREGSNGYILDRCSNLSYFDPSRLLEYVKALAKFPDGGTDRLALLIANAQLKAFYRSKGYPELPSFQTDGEISDSDDEVPQSNSESTEVGTIEQSNSTFSDLISRKKISRGFNKQNDVLEDGRKRKSLSELMETEDSQLVNGVKTKSSGAYDFESTFSSGKKYKFNDSDSSDSGKGKKKRLDSLGDMEVKLPSTTITSSFKVGECIRRVASQLTGSSSNLKANNETSLKKVFKDDSIFDVFVSDGFSHNVTQSPSFELENLEDCPSPDEMLSLLYLIAADPIQGYSYLSTISSFLTQFRNCCISTSASEKKHPEKAWVRRDKKRKVEPQPAVSDMTEPDHMQDSYWSDLISHNSPAKIKVEAHTRSQRKKRKSSGQTSTLTLVPIVQGPEHLQVGIASPNMKQALSTDRSIISVEEKMVDECTPTALILTFNGSKSLPSESDLIRIFGRYGPLKDTSTEVQAGNKRVKVVFKRRADAEIAFSSAGKYSIFGPSLLSYRLRYLPSTPDSSPDTMQLEKSNALLEESNNLEVPGHLHSSISGVSPDTDPQGRSGMLCTNSSDSNNLHLSMPNASLDANLQEKIEAVMTENSHTDITSDPHSSVWGVSLDTNLQNQSDAVVLTDNIHTDIPVDLQPSALDTSIDTNPLNKSDSIVAENNNVDVPNCLYPSASDASLDTNLQNQNDAVVTESSITNIPSDLHPPMSDTCPDASLHEKNVTVSDISSSDVVGNNITNVHSQLHSSSSDASLDTNIQNQSNAVLVENSITNIPSDLHPPISDSCPDAGLNEKDNRVADIANSNMVLTESSITNIHCEIHSSVSDASLLDLRNGSDAALEDGGSTDLPGSLHPSNCDASPEANLQCESDVLLTESSNTNISGNLYVSTLDTSEDSMKIDKTDVALMETSNIECSVKAAEEDVVLDTMQVVSEGVVAKAEVDEKAG